MFIILLCSAFLVVILWLLIKWLKVRKFWSQRNVPHYRPHPILGSLTFIMKENPAIWMRKLYKDFRSPYVGIWLFWRPSLVINSPEISKRILIMDGNNFRNRFVSSGKRDPIGSLNMFTANDPLWSNVRKRLTPTFTSAKLRSIQNLMLTKSNNLRYRVQEELKNGRIIDLRSLFSDYSTDVIGEAAFGVHCDATLTGQSGLRNVTKEFMKYDIWRGLSFMSMFFIPELCDIFGFTFFPKNATNYLVVLFKEMVKRRGGYENKYLKHKDILDALMKLKTDAANEGEDIDEAVLVSQAAVLLQGGFDTSAVTLTFAIYELAYQPHAQERLYTEIKDAKDAIGGADFDSSHLTDLPYLNAVINETLRKYPSLGWLDRIANEDYPIDKDLTISKGTVVYVNAVGMHYDPEYFPDPESFDPERFMPENEANIKPYTFMPFGEGLRSCLGKRFAYQSLRFAMSSIILNFELRPILGAPKPNECHIEKKGLFLMPEAVMSVQFIPRF